MFFPWSFLAYNVLVIVWGGLVRASGSGAGCGAHWPLCNGEWIPQNPQMHTLIELTHRAMSGLALVGVIILWFWSRKKFSHQSLVRRAASLSVLLMLSEALIGAGLVLLKLVAEDSSLLRAGYLSVHLLNTFLLLAALTTVAWASHHPSATCQDLRKRPEFPLLRWAILGTLLLAITGGIAALGDTLFPAASLHDGFVHDFIPGVHFLVHLRVIHPVLAVLLAFLLVFLAMRAVYTGSSRELRVWAQGLLLIVALQIFIGAWNLIWLAPVVLQLAHLLTADLLWIVLILFTLSHATGEASDSRWNNTSKL